MFSAADRSVAAVAARQDRVVTRRQALAVGMTARQLTIRCAAGGWRRLAPGVYLVGPGTPSHRQLVRAALLTMPCAVASHETAAELLGIGPLPRGRVVVTVGPAGRHVSRLARVHRSRTLVAEDVQLVDGMALTGRCRTLVDLGSLVPAPLLARLIDDQLAQRLVGLGELRATFDRLGRHRASMGGLRRTLDERGPGFVAPESELERAFLRLVDRYGLPPPERQFAAPWLGPELGRVDFAYPNARLVVEVDGRRWHSRDAAARRDRARDRQAQLAGWMVLRYGYEEVTSNGEEVVTEVRHALWPKLDARSVA